MSLVRRPYTDGDKYLSDGVVNRLACAKSVRRTLRLSRASEGPRCQWRCCDDKYVLHRDPVSGTKQPLHGLHELPERPGGGRRRKSVEMGKIYSNDSRDLIDSNRFASLNRMDNYRFGYQIPITGEYRNLRN